MVTSATIYHVLRFLNFNVDIRNVCVFLAPLFSSLTTLVTYHLTKELATPGAGLVAAVMIAVVPGYISRSVAGSYDNEGIAIFCMLLTYYTWIKAVKTGSLSWSVLCALAYFYMVGVPHLADRAPWTKDQLMFISDPGVVVGRLRFSHQSHPAARTRADGLGTIFPPRVRGVLGIILYWDDLVDANSLRRVPASPQF
jgi:hypothetical protein